jgi:hypothetical protein
MPEGMSVSEQQSGQEANVAITEEHIVEPEEMCESPTDKTPESGTK